MATRDYHADPIPVLPWRCDVTNNPIGSDTVMIGAGFCQCQGCRAYRRVDALEDQCAGLEIDLVNAGNDMAELRALLD
ncbi:hypothetical protein LCGC14_1845570, partial [marine sediment metagenome]